MAASDGRLLLYFSTCSMAACRWSWLFCAIRVNICGCVARGVEPGGEFVYLVFVSFFI